jgi:hypothetical protein
VERPHGNAADLVLQRELQQVGDGDRLPGDVLEGHASGEEEVAPLAGLVGVRRGQGAHAVERHPRSRRLRSLPNRQLLDARLERRGRALLHRRDGSRRVPAA